MLGYCWLFALFLSRSARCFTHVQGDVDSAPTYLTAILPKNLKINVLLIVGGPRLRTSSVHVIPPKRGKVTVSSIALWPALQIGQR